MVPFVVLGVLTLVFIIMRVLPADVARLVAGIDADETQVEQVRKQLNLDGPMYQQYALYMRQAAVGDLGKSIYSNRPVLPDTFQDFGNTAILAGAAVIFSSTFGVGLGILAAANRRNALDGIVSLIAAGSLAFPSFFFGLVLILLFSEKLRLLPALGSPDAKHLVLPVITLGLPAAASITRMTRASVLEVLHEDYIRTARAKGVKERMVLLRHALKPALLPVITIVGLQLGALLGGTVIIETVFGYPGLGSGIVQGIRGRDFPVVQAGVVLIAIVFTLTNLVVDLAYSWLDPRIRYS